MEGEEASRLCMTQLTRVANRAVANSFVERICNPFEIESWGDGLQIRPTSLEMLVRSEDSTTPYAEGCTPVVVVRSSVFDTTSAGGRLMVGLVLGSAALVFMVVPFLSSLVTFLFLITSIL
jgi:hypothetical protein